MKNKIIHTLLMCLFSFVSFAQSVKNLNSQATIRPLPTTKIIALDAQGNAKNVVFKEMKDSISDPLNVAINQKASQTDLSNQDFQLRSDLATKQSVNTLEGYLEQEETARGGADNFLQGQINTEVGTRSSQINAINTSLGSKASASDLSAEAAARVAGDAGKADTATVLWQKINNGFETYLIGKDSMNTVFGQRFRNKETTISIRVDPVNGNDMNDGLTATTPVKTYARATTIINQSTALIGSITAVGTSPTNRLKLGGGFTTKYCYINNGYYEIDQQIYLYADMIIRGDIYIAPSVVYAFGIGYYNSKVLTLGNFGTNTGSVVTFSANNQRLIRSSGTQKNPEFHLYCYATTLKSGGFTGIKLFEKTGYDPRVTAVFDYCLPSIDSCFDNNITLGDCHAISSLNQYDWKGKTPFYKHIANEEYATVLNYSTDLSVTYNDRSFIDKGFFDKKTKSKTLTLPNNADFSIDLESGIQVTTLLSFTSGNIVTPPTINATFSNIRDGGIYRIRLTGTYNTGYIVFPSNVYKKDGSAMGTYTCLPETLIFHAEGTNLICDNK